MSDSISQPGPEHTGQVLAFTLTSAVSRWQFLHERLMPEKALSGLSNLLSLALRKNVEKGSCRDEERS